MHLVLGKMTAPISGNFTTLNAIVPANPDQTARNLGYGVGRLAQGFSILLLRAVPSPDQFELDGLTLRSGGRLGKPAETAAEDARRPRVHDDIMRTRGAGGYQQLQQVATRSMHILGTQRLAKIIPVTRHNPDPDLAPSVQYPMGGGFAQWRLKQPGLPFYNAAFVGPDGTVSTPENQFIVNSGNFPVDYQARADLNRYLANA